MLIDSVLPAPPLLRTTCATTPSAPESFARIGLRLYHVLFPAEDDRWLTILRTGLAIQLIGYCLSLRVDWFALFGTEGAGFVDRGMMEAIMRLEAPLIPTVGCLVSIGHVIGLHEDIVLGLTWIALLAASVGLLAGCFCRTSAFSAWLLYVCAAKSGNLLGYGVDSFTTIGLFYLAISPLPDRLSVDWRVFCRRPKRLPRS
jgi:hypothetical protein